MIHYEYNAPGDLLHIGTKKLARIVKPDSRRGPEVPSTLPSTIITALPSLPCCPTRKLPHSRVYQNSHERLVSLAPRPHLYDWRPTSHRVPSIAKARDSNIIFISGSQGKYGSYWEVIS
jgi:hypothetical protein